MDRSDAKRDEVPTTWTLGVSNGTAAYLSNELAIDWQRRSILQGLKYFPWYDVVCVA